MTMAPADHNLFSLRDVAFNDAVAALIVLDDGRYLMQLRDDKPGIFYPDHWGLFGGAVDPGETPEQALFRELDEELGFRPGAAAYFARMDFDYAGFGSGTRYRTFYEVRLTEAERGGLVLGEGRRMEAFAAPDLLLTQRVAPYDSFPIWLHHMRGRLDLTSRDERT